MFFKYFAVVFFTGRIEVTDRGVTMRRMRNLLAVIAFTFFIGYFVLDDRLSFVLPTRSTGHKVVQIEREPFQLLTIKVEDIPSVLVDSISVTKNSSGGARFKEASLPPDSKTLKKFPHPLS